MRSLILIPLLAFCTSEAAADWPLTRAESSGYTATSTHAEVMAFVRELQQRSPRIRVETLGTSTEGRPIPLLVIGAPAPASPGELRHDRRRRCVFPGQHSRRRGRRQGGGADGGA